MIKLLETLTHFTGYAPSFVFFPVTSICAGFLLVIPLIFQWKIGSSDVSSADCSVTISIVSCLIVSIPLTLDSICDILSSPLLQPFQLFLLFGITVPNIVFLSVSFTPEVLFIAFQIRYLFCGVICFLHLTRYGDPIFHRWNFKAMGVINSLVLVGFSWSSFNIAISNEIILILLCCGYVISSLMNFYFVLLWYRKHLKFNNKKQELRCGVCFFPMMFLMIGFLIISLLYGHNLPMYLTSCNYISMMFILLVWLFHGRNARFEIRKANVRVI